MTVDFSKLDQLEWVELIEVQVTLQQQLQQLQQQGQEINQRQQLVGNEIMDRIKKHKEEKAKEQTPK